MPHNFKTTESILKSYLIVSVPIVIIMLAMYYIIFWAYRTSVEADKGMQMKNAVQLRITDIESQLNHYIELEDNFNTSINAFGMVSDYFEYKFFQKYIAETLEKMPEITSFWIWFSPAPDVFYPPSALDSTFSWAPQHGFFMRYYRETTGANKKDVKYRFQKLSPAAFEFLMRSEPLSGPINDKEVTFSEPYICNYLPTKNDEKHRVVSFSSPIINTRQSVIGVTGFDIRLEDIAKQINGLATNVYTKVCLLSKDGVYLSHFDLGRLGVHVRHNTLFQNQKSITDSILKHAANNTSFDVDVLNKGLTGIDTTARNNTIHFNNVQLPYTKGNYVTTAVFMPKARFEVDYTQFQQTIFVYATVTILLTLLFIFALAVICNNVLYNRMYMEASGLNKAKI